MRIFLLFILMLIKMCFSLAAELENGMLKAEAKILPSLRSFENEALPMAIQVVPVDLRDTILNNYPVIITEDNTEEDGPFFCGMCCCPSFNLPGNMADVFSPLTPFASFQSITSAATTSSRNLPEYGIGIWSVHLIRR